MKEVDEYKSLALEVEAVRTDIPKLLALLGSWRASRRICQYEVVEGDAIKIQPTLAAKWLEHRDGKWVVRTLFSIQDDTNRFRQSLTNCLLIPAFLQASPLRFPV